MRKIHWWPNHTSTSIQAGHTGGQFLRGVRTLIVTHCLSSGRPWRMTMWEIGQGEIRFIKQSTWSKKPWEESREDWRYLP